MNMPDVIRFTGPQNNEQFLISNTLQAGEKGSLLFCTETALRLLADNTQWFMDGTFKVAPDMFRQLFTLHVLKSGKVLPCAYGLMVSKRKAPY